MKYDQWKINMDFILCVNVFVHSRPFIQEMFKKKKKKKSLQYISENKVLLIENQYHLNLQSFTTHSVAACWKFDMYVQYRE